MMFNIHSTVTALLVAGLHLPSFAACATPSVRVNMKALMTSLLEGNTACVPAITQPTMEAQELHQAGGALIDYKLGPSDLKDPSTKVGTWAVTGTDGRGVFVTYDYGGGRSYTYSVWDNMNGTHSYCSANPEILVRIKAGGGPC